MRVKVKPARVLKDSPGFVWTVTLTCSRPSPSGTASTCTGGRGAHGAITAVGVRVAVATGTKVFVGVGVFAAVGDDVTVGVMVGVLVGISCGPTTVNGDSVETWPVITCRSRSTL